MMQIKFPEAPKILEKKDNLAVFQIDGCYPGYGVTLGNALRRVILSSLPGSAVTSIQIKGINHEFSTIPNVMEDVINIILNLKQVRFKMHQEGVYNVSIKENGEKKVTAKDIKVPSQLEVVNKNQHIATLTNRKANLEIDMTVEEGLGFVTIEEKHKQKLEVGSISLDAIFTPIKKVSYDVENMRVGEKTDYNRLIMVIETDGSITPEQALKDAADILSKQFGMITDNIELPEEKSRKKEKSETLEKNENISKIKKAPIKKQVKKAKKTKK